MIDLLHSILNKAYLCDPQGLLVESQGKEKKAQKINIKSLSGCTHYLYRLEVEKNKLYPFFCEVGSAHPAPKLLHAFCDYLLLAERDDKCVVFLIELKRGGSSPTAQLNAGYCFATFLLETAKRIFTNHDIDTSKVHIVKVAIKDRERKRTTKQDMFTKEEDYLNYHFTDFILSAMIKEVHSKKNQSA